MHKLVFKLFLLAIICGLLYLGYLLFVQPSSLFGRSPIQAVDTAYDDGLNTSVSQEKENLQNLNRNQKNSNNKQQNNVNNNQFYYKLIINKDQSLYSIAMELKNKGLISSKRIFILLFRLFDKDKKILPGRYILNYGMSTWDIFRKLSISKPDQISVTILDGINILSLRKHIDNLEYIKHDTKNMTDDELVNALQIPYASLEGLFFPDTYFVAPGQSDLKIYHMAYQNMKRKLAKYWDSRLAYFVEYDNEYEMLIMASLIQKESGIPDDMKMISATFNNRIRIGMKLQTDPSVFYPFDTAQLARKHRGKKIFSTDHPHNTYTRLGMPPTPICLPSDNALLAASKPTEDRKVLFFVASGRDIRRTRFSYNYKEHLKKVRLYRRGE